MHSRNKLILLFTHLRIIISKDICQNGEFFCSVSKTCLPEDDICNGRRDCEDASDETEELCSRITCAHKHSNKQPVDLIMLALQQFDLPPIGCFRCTYGACIPVNFKCNGVPNCLDGSDETEDACGFSKCNRKQFRCAYGACINKYFKCNGKIDCPDSSDETSELCMKHRRRCRPGYFRCGYGACIHKRKKCNGVADCADQSDESQRLCEFNHSFKNTRPPFPLFTPTTKPNIELKHTPTTKPLTTAFSLQNKTPNTTPRKAELASTFPSSAYMPVKSVISSQASLLIHAEAPTTTSQPQTLNVKLSTTTPQFLSSTMPYINGTTTRQHQFLTTRTVPLSKLTSHIHSQMSPSLTGTTTSPTTTTDDVTINFPAAQLINPCPRNKCACPAPLKLCVHCPPGTNLHRVCHGLEKEKLLCSLDVVDDVHLEILSCGTHHLYPNIDAEFIRSHSNICGIPEGVPARTTGFLECWGKSWHLVRCQPDGRWHPYTITDRHLEMENLCQLPTINSDVCGKLPSTKVSHPELSWPFLVGLMNDGDVVCSGTLIASQWILTSASCATSFQVSSVMALNFSSEAKYSAVKVHSTLIHPNFTSSWSRLRSNLALLKLEKPLVLSERLVPACVQETETSLDEIAATFQLQDSVQRLKWNLVTQRQDCTLLQDSKKTICPHYIDTEDEQFCGRAASPFATFEGRSLGGPYFINAGADHHEKWTLAGVVSHVFNLPHCPTRTIFTSVFKHIDWIKHCVEEDICPKK